MTATDQLRTLFAHAEWADRRILDALRTLGDAAPVEAIREQTHLVGADEVWLSRVEGRASSVPVWPAPSLATIESLTDSVHAGWRRVLDTLRDDRLGERVAYTNSAGQSFETPLGDILLHVAMHAQYHRGKVNLLLRQAGHEPAPADVITYVRGVPAARTEVR
jgi:uncharacterized damage-inducible protein DinB